MALGKKVLVRCPGGMLRKFPSDLCGLCLSIYAGKDKKPTDKWGLLPQFSGMVRDVLVVKGITTTLKADDLNDEECFCVAKSE